MKKKVYTMPNVKAMEIKTPSIMATSGQAVEIETYEKVNSTVTNSWFE